VRRAQRAWLGLAAALFASVPAARAHVVIGSKTLSALVAESDLVLHGRIVSVEDDLRSLAGPPGTRRPGVEAEVREVLKGSLEAPRIRFAQHGHGVAPFEPGREALVFLIAIDRSRELDALGRAGTHAWVSLQEHEDAYPLEGPLGERLLAVTRAYVAAGAAPSAEARTAALRRATLGALRSGDARLAASAVTDLALAPEAPLVTAADRPALQAVLDDAGTAMGVRVGLLAALERRGLGAGPPGWLRLLADDVPAPDRVIAIRAAGVSGGDAVRARLLALLADPDPAVAAAAAAAVGNPGRDEAVPPLAAALESEAAPVRMAAIRGLGRIATADSLRALESAAASHPDPATRRRARAELAKRRATRAPP